MRQMLKSAQLDGYFTNHSLHRTNTTCLFQVGVNRKMIKEFIGHKSDAVDQYQITSDMQRESLSKIIEGESSNSVIRNKIQIAKEMTVICINI